MQFRAGARSDYVVRPVDDLTLVYHRPAGITHVVRPDCAALLALLHEDALTVDEVIARLSALHDLEPADGATVAETIAARLDEMAAMDIIDRLT